MRNINKGSNDQPLRYVTSRREATRNLRDVVHQVGWPCGTLEMFYIKKGGHAGP